MRLHYNPILTLLDELMPRPKDFSGAVPQFWRRNLTNRALEPGLAACLRSFRREHILQASFPSRADKKGTMHDWCRALCQLAPGRRAPGVWGTASRLAARQIHGPETHRSLNLAPVEPVQSCSAIRLLFSGQRLTTPNSITLPCFFPLRGSHRTPVLVSFSVLFTSLPSTVQHRPSPLKPCQQRSSRSLGTARDCEQEDTLTPVSRSTRDRASSRVLSAPSPTWGRCTLLMSEKGEAISYPRMVAGTCMSLTEWPFSNNR